MPKYGSDFTKNGWGKTIASQWPLSSGPFKPSGSVDRVEWLSRHELWLSSSGKTIFDSHGNSLRVEPCPNSDMVHAAHKMDREARGMKFPGPVTSQSLRKPDAPDEPDGLTGWDDIFSEEDYAH